VADAARFGGVRPAASSGKTRRPANGLAKSWPKGGALGGRPALAAGHVGGADRGRGGGRLAGVRSRAPVTGPGRSPSSSATGQRHQRSARRRSKYRGVQVRRGTAPWTNQAKDPRLGAWSKGAPAAVRVAATRERRRGVLDRGARRWGWGNVTGLGNRHQRPGDPDRLAGKGWTRPRTRFRGPGEARRPGGDGRGRP